MTAPRQLQLRDLLHQAAAGLVLLALFLFLTWHCWPGGLGRRVDLPLLLATLDSAALLLLPAWLILLYVLGAVVPNPYGVLARGGLLQRGMLALRILERQHPQAAALLRAKPSATQKWREERIAAAFDLSLEELTPGELEDLFRLMAAKVMSREPTLAQLDVERHFGLALFNARLATLFFLFLVASLAGLLGKLLSPALPAAAGAAPWPGLLALAAGSYLAARTCGRRAQGIYRQWHRLVVDAFVAGEVGT